MKDPRTDPAASRTAVDAVRTVARDYIEGWYAGDGERMRGSLHDELVKRTPLREDDAPTHGLRVVSKDRMVELTSSGGGSDVTDPAIEVFVDDVSVDIACARTVCADFVDYLQLVETPEGWKIANIIFRTLR